MRRAGLALLLGLLAAACAGPRPVPSPPARDTLVVLVRHGEKQAGDDPALTPAGEARAAALAALLEGLPVDAVFSTPTRRTRATAEPTARARGLAVQLDDAGGTNAGDFARRVLSAHAGRAVLVVGHSNTLPALAEAFGGGPMAPVADDEYDRLVVVTVPAQGAPRRVVARYGAPSAPAAPR